MKRIYRMEEHGLYTPDERLRLELAQARINHAVSTTHVLTPEFLTQVERWHPHVAVEQGDVRNDSFPVAYATEARMYRRQDNLYGEQQELEEEARGALVASLLFVTESYELPVGSASVTEADNSLAGYALNMGLDTDVSALSHQVYLGHRNRPALYDEATIFDAPGPTGLAIVVANDRTFERPDSAHIIVPELPDVQRFLRFCIRDVNFDQDSITFLELHADTFNGAQLVVGTGFKELYE